MMVRWKRFALPKVPAEPALRAFVLPTDRHVFAAVSEYFSHAFVYPQA